MHIPRRGRLYGGVVSPRSLPDGLVLAQLGTKALVDEIGGLGSSMVPALGTRGVSILKVPFGFTQGYKANDAAEATRWLGASFPVNRSFPRLTVIIEVECIANFPPNYQRFVTWADDTFTLRSWGTGFQLLAKVNGSGYSNSVGSVYDAGKRYFAASYDGAALRQFVNGAQVWSTNVSGSLTGTNSYVVIQTNGLWGEDVNGRVLRTMVFSRALSTAEIYKWTYGSHLEQLFISHAHTTALFPLQAPTATGSLDLFSAADAADITGSYLDLYRSGTVGAASSADSSAFAASLVTLGGLSASLAADVAGIVAKLVASGGSSAVLNNDEISILGRVWPAAYQAATGIRLSSPVSTIGSFPPVATSDVVLR